MKTFDDIKRLVQNQLELIQDEIVLIALKELLVEPFTQERDCYGEMIVCWVIADHLESNTRFLYSEAGFGPEQPWGIVSISGPDVGMDSNWFESLEGAFYDSFASVSLKIWNVIRRNVPNSDRIIASDLTMDEAYDLIARLNAEQNVHRHDSSLYTSEPRMRKWY